jgi:hypothetical protein
MSALVVAGCGSHRSPAPPSGGSVQALVQAAPSAVKAVRVAVTGGAIAGDVHADMAFADGHWTGTVPNVPAALSAYVVTARAYNSATVPADPEDPTALIFKGSTYNVSVVAGQVSAIKVVLLPYPNNSGEIGINTPPHLTGLTHPDWIEANAVAALTARAVDPDPATLLTYTFTDGGAGGSFAVTSAGAVVNQAPGDLVSVDYTPAFNFVGTATIRLEVTDGHAAASTTFRLAVGSGVTPTLLFDALPEIQVTAVGSQELVQGGSTTIDYQLVYPADPGPDAPSSLEVQTSWSDSCGGSFTGASSQETVTSGQAPTPRQVTYKAPPVTASGSGQCELVLSVSDHVGASVWSKVFVWVAPVSDFGGTWSGQMSQPEFQPSPTTLVFDQAGTAVSGTLQMSDLFPVGDVSGSLTGTVDGTRLAFSVSVLQPDWCTGTLTGTASAGATSMDVTLTGSLTCGIEPMALSGTLLPVQKVAFVTNRGIPTGNLGGLAGADAICNAAATAPGSVVPAGTYKALLSTSTVDARDRIVNGRYVLDDGTLVASSKTTLFGVGLSSAVNRTELGAAAGGWNVLTGTNPDGTSTGSNCLDWTANNFPNGTMPGVIWAKSAWLGCGWYFCDSPAAVYCFQQ